MSVKVGTEKYLLFEGMPLINCLPNREWNHKLIINE